MLFDSSFPALRSRPGKCPTLFGRIGILAASNRSFSSIHQRLPVSNQLPSYYNINGLNSHKDEASAILLNAESSRELFHPNQLFALWGANLSMSNELRASLTQTPASNTFTMLKLPQFVEKGIIARQIFPSRVAVPAFSTALRSQAVLRAWFSSLLVIVLTKAGFSADRCKPGLPNTYGSPRDLPHRVNIAIEIDPTFPLICSIHQIGRRALLRGSNQENCIKGVSFQMGGNTHSSNDDCEDAGVGRHRDWMFHGIPLRWPCDRRDTAWFRLVSRVKIIYTASTRPVTSILVPW
jgi:hypothetical protein